MNQGKVPPLHGAEAPAKQKCGAVDTSSGLESGDASVTRERDASSRLSGRVSFDPSKPAGGERTVPPGEPGPDGHALRHHSSQRRGAPSGSASASVSSSVKWGQHSSRQRVIDRKEQVNVCKVFITVPVTEKALG